MAKFLTLNIGGKATEIPLADDSPAGITQALSQAFPGETVRFPDSADALDDALASTTVTPTTTDPDGGGLSLNRIAQVLTASNARATDRRQAESPIANAARERFLDPLLRLNQPAGTDLGGLFPGGPTTGAGELGQNVSDVLQAGSAAATPGLAALGAGAQALGQTLGQSPTGARIVGGVTELLAGLAGVPAVSYLAARTGRKLVEPTAKAIAGLPVAADLLPMERVSTALNAALSNTFRRTSKILGKEFDAVEAATVLHEPSILPGSTAYDKLGEIIDYTNDSVAVFGSAGGDAMKRIAEHVAAGEAVPTAELLRLRKGLKDLATRGRSFDPDVASNAKKAIHVRNETGKALEAVMDPQTLARWRTVNSAWSSTVAEPLSVLHNVLDSKSPYEAFRAVFQNQDPEVFRTVLRVAQNTPSVAGKLKLGFLETVRENTNTFQNAGKMSAILDQLTPMVQSAGLFNAEEMSALSTFVRRKSIIPVTQALAQVFSLQGQGLMRLGTGLAVTSAVTHDPTSLFIAGAAAGALPAMRRLAILPPGSAAAKRAALAIANQITRFAASMAKDRTRPIETGATLAGPN
jgi:hypothetical protein